MAAWRFQWLIRPNGEIPFRDWYDGQDEEIQTIFITTARRLQATWDGMKPQKARTAFRPLTKRHKHPGFGQICYDTDTSGDRRKQRRRVRIPTLTRPDERKAILIVGALKTSLMTYEPPNAFDDALAWVLDLEAGRGSCDDQDLW